jgi:hypothetical protein
MASIRFTDVQTRPTEFLDLTVVYPQLAGNSLTLQTG